MKNRTRLSVLSGISGFILLLSMTGCKDLLNDPLKDKETGEDITLLLLDLNVIKTKLAIHLVDIRTNQPISLESGEIEIQFLGEDAGDIITMTGEKPDKFVTSTDFLQVGHDPNLEVNTENPLELTIYAQGPRYVSAPQFVSFTQEGIKDVVIKMIAVGSGKSANTAAYNEPYDITFNGIIKSTQLSFIGDVSASPTGTAWQYVNLYRPLVPGNITCSNLTEPVLYSDYGIYYLGLANGINHVPPAPAVKNASLAGGDLVFSAILRSGMNKCNTGLTILINSSDDKPGTAMFEYSITFSDGTKQNGMISATFPSGHLIEPIYYPASNPAVTVELKGNSQYEMTGGVNLASPCGGQASFTATSKSELTLYKFIVRYSCPDSQIGFALSIGGQFRKSGSADPWSSFSFTEGVCFLQLESNADYDFRISINGTYHSYTLPTNPGTMESFILEHQNEDYRIKSLSITPSAELVVIDADVEFSSNVCDDLFIKK